jgi:hypothetical protein
MRSSNRILTIALALTFLSAASFAAKKESKTLSLGTTAIVGGQELKPGDYKLQWDGSSDSTQVTFYKNNKEVATVPAQVVHQKNQSNASYEVNTADGQKQLDRVYFANEVLEFGKSDNSMQTQGTASGTPSTP